MMWRLPLLLWLFWTQAQTPRPNAGNSPRSSISGRVIRAGTNDGIANAVVRVPAQGRSTTTDVLGNFRLDLTPGRLLLTAERDGFSLQPDPAHNITEAGASIRLLPGQSITNFVLPM